MGERELPKKREITTFGECCKSIRYGVGMPPEYSDDGVPFIRATNVKKGTISEKNLKYVSIENSQTIEKCRIHEGNLIVVRSGVNTGDCAYVPKKFDGALAGFDLIVEFDNHESAKFFNFFINSRYGTSQIDRLKRRAAQEHLNSEQLSSLKVPNPHIALKRQIVAVLEQAEAVKRQRQEADALTGALLQSVFREMFGNDVKEESRWEWKKLGDIATLITKGATPTSYGYAFQKSGIKFVKIENIINNQIAESSIKQFISPEAHENQKRSILESGDILFSIAGTIGNICLVKEKDLPSNINQAIAVIKGTSKEFDPNFLLFFLRTNLALDQITKKSRGVALSNVSLGDVRDIFVMTPTLALQQQFARVVQDVERIREQQVASGRQIEGLCEGLMQRAFKGELVA